MKVIELDTIESSELVEQTFRFWFSDQGHIRSPFPDYIRTALKQRATERFFNWAKSINPKAKDELSDEIIGEKFEELIFETATELVKTEDECITIRYPFLPRIGDQLVGEEDALNKVVDRNLLKEEDHNYLKVFMERIDTGEKWDTKFELPL